MTSATPNTRRAYWLKTLHEWHWIASALALVGMLFFSVTGITLNNAALFDAPPVVSNQQAQLPDQILAHLTSLSEQGIEDESVALPTDFLTWSQGTLGVDTRNATQEWSDRDLNLSMERPGGDAWMSVHFSDGKVKLQDTNNGWIAYFNDLHKGHYTSRWWTWFIDAMGVSCLIFALTGFFILFLHAKNRPATWPLVGLGLLIPILLILLSIH